MDDNGERIRKNVAKMRSMGASDAEVEQYLTQHEGLRPVAQPPSHDYHAEYKSGALGKRMQGANARDVANAQEETAAAPGYGERLATHVLNTGQGIPGVEAVEAGAGALGGGMSANLATPEGRATAIEAGTPAAYRRSLGTLRENTSQIGGKTRVAEQLVGSIATLPVLPASPMRAGALLGGATQALDADPDASVGGRVVRGAAGAAGGALIGKAGELAVTGLRAFGASPAATKLMAMKAARAKQAEATYAAALLQGKGRTNTPQIRAWLAKPDIAEIADELAQTRPYEGVARDDPQMLDAIYKVLSDRAGVVKKGLESVTPNRPNIGRFRGEDIAAAQQEGLDAMSGGTSMPGPMRDYRKGVTEYAADSRNIDALRRGNDALRNRLSEVIPTGKNLDRTTPEALTQWAGKASDAERQSATAGVLGALKGQPKATMGRIAGVPLIPKPSKALRAAPDLLRTVDPRQRTYDALVKAGLLVPNEMAAP